MKLWPLQFHWLNADTCKGCCWRNHHSRRAHLSPTRRTDEYIVHKMYTLSTSFSKKFWKRRNLNALTNKIEKIGRYCVKQQYLWLKIMIEQWSVLNFYDIGKGMYLKKSVWNNPKFILLKTQRSITSGTDLGTIWWLREPRLPRHCFKEAKSIISARMINNWNVKHERIQKTFFQKFLSI